jgi:hypothetical protein
MEVFFYDIAFNYLLSTLGLLIYVGWKVREHLHNFNLKILINHNKPFFIWASFMQVLIAFVAVISPDASVAIKTIIGLDVTNEPSAFITLGWALAMAAETASKKQLDEKKEIINKKKHEENF